MIKAFYKEKEKFHMLRVGLIYKVHSGLYNRRYILASSHCHSAPTFPDLVIETINLVGSRGLFLILLKPALLNGGGLTGGGLALNLNFLALVGLQFIGKVGLLGRLGSSGNAELLDVSLGITGLDGGRLEGTEFTEVELLNRVGLTDSGGQESAARSRRNLLPRDAGEERASRSERLGHHRGGVEIGRAHV